MLRSVPGFRRRPRPGQCARGCCGVVLQALATASPDPVIDAAVTCISISALQTNKQQLHHHHGLIRLEYLPATYNLIPELSCNMYSSSCEELVSPNIPNFSLSVFIVFGILVSYIPQHLRIIFRRSSEGLSPYFVLLGTTSSTFAIFNIITLPQSQSDIGCCSEISRFACVAGLLGIAQVAVQWGCFSLM